MMDVAATKAELIKKIAALPDLLPDETEDERAQVLEVLRLFANISDIVTAMIEHDEGRAKNWQATVEAMQEIERGEYKTFATVEELMADLYADD